MVSLGLVNLCLFPRVAKGLRQKEINSFVSEMSELACIIITIAVIKSIQHVFFKLLLWQTRTQPYFILKVLK